MQSGIIIDIHVRDIGVRDIVMCEFAQRKKLILNTVKFPSEDSADSVFEHQAGVVVPGKFDRSQDDGGRLGSRRVRLAALKNR
jgi:hypothetical protein